MVLDCLANTTEHSGINMFIKKIFLPRLPDNMIAEVYHSIESNLDKVWTGDLDMYSWIPANDAIQEWCKKNISPDLYWGVQVIDNNLPMHKDHGTEIKFNYIIDRGSINAKTNYYDNQGVLLDSYVMDEHTWYILNVTINHSVTDIMPGRRRVSITSRVMP